MRNMLQIIANDDFNGLLEVEKLSLAADFKVTNPERRREIRADFPRAFRATETGQILKTVEKELARDGVSLSDIERINIAYPHKHSDIFKGHHDSMDPALFVGNLRYEMPQIKWAPAEGLVETVHLNRSGNQCCIHALVGKQVYAIEGLHNPFINYMGERAQPYFIVLDHFMEQGTTMANLVSFIEHNGGKVLLMVASDQNFAQRNTRAKYPNVRLSDEFADASRNTGRLAGLAQIFAQSAQKNPDPDEQPQPTPQRCLEIFEKALNRHNNSLFALTDGECIRLKDTIRGQADQTFCFWELVGRLNAKTPLSTTHAPVFKDIDSNLKLRYM